MKIVECSTKLYYCDNINDNKTDVISYSCLEMVSENLWKYTKAENERAAKARRYQAILGWPSPTTFLNIIRKNLVSSCDISKNDGAKDIKKLILFEKLS